MSAHGNFEFGNVYLLRNHGPVPAHEKLVVRRKDALVKDFEGRLEQRRPAALENHRFLFRKVGRQVPPIRAPRQRKFDKTVSPSWKCGRHSTGHNCALQKAATVRCEYVLIDGAHDDVSCPATIGSPFHYLII